MCVNYVFAIFLPPLSVLFAGKPLTAILVGLIWLASVALTLGLSHPIFVILAWIIIARARGDKRHRELLKMLKERE